LTVLSTLTALGGATIQIHAVAKKLQQQNSAFHRGGAMPTDTFKLEDKDSTAEAIRRLGEEDLLYLNHLIVERLKLISQARSTSLMAAFGPGDHVEFKNQSGERKTGSVLQLHKKTASIRTDDGQLWKVHPAYLRRLNTPENP